MADIRENALFAFLDSLVETNTHKELMDVLKQTYDRPSDEEIAKMVEQESFLRRQQAAEAARKAAEAKAIADRKEAAEVAQRELEAAVTRAKAAADAAAADEVAVKKKVVA